LTQPEISKYKITTIIKRDSSTIHGGNPVPSLNKREKKPKPVELSTKATIPLTNNRFSTSPIGATYTIRK